MLAHGHLMYQDTQGLFCKAALQLQPGLVHWAVPPETKDLASVKHQEAPGGCSAPSEEQHSCVISSQFGNVCNPAGGALYPVTQVINPRC